MSLSYLSKLKLHSRTMCSGLRLQLLAFAVPQQSRMMHSVAAAATASVAAHSNVSSCILMQGQDVRPNLLSASLTVQSGLLAQQDSFAPMLWVGVQTVLNIIGDVLLIKVMGLGLEGAAWATVLSQLAGTIGLIWMLTFRGQVCISAVTTYC